MNERPGNERWMEQLAERTEAVGMAAPSRLKATIYSRLVQAQAQSVGLATLTESSQRGFGLCVFEKLVQIVPTGEPIQKLNPCRVCHARVLAERMENAPIYWPNCPYVGFQNR